MMAVRIVEVGAPDDEGYCTNQRHVGPRVLPASAFRVRHDRPSGRYSHCRACEAADASRRRRRAMIKMRLAIYGILPE